MALRQRSRDRLDRDDEHGGRGSWLPLVVAAIALLGLGVWIGRASQPAQEPPAPPETTTPEDDASIDWPGPTDTENGVPVGYERTEAGAVAAAVNYDQTWTAAGAERLSEILDVAASADAREDLRGGLEAGLRETIRDLGLDYGDADFVARAGYGGWSLDSYTENAATVRLWMAGQMVDPRVGGLDAGWGTTTIGLVWEQGDWRVASFRTADGPAAEEANNGDPRRTSRKMKEFEEFWYVPR